MTPPRAPVWLLAVDAGVRTGMAALDGSGLLLWCRSRNFGSSARLRRAAAGLLDSLPDLGLLAVEGGGRLGEIWTAEAVCLGLWAAMDAGRLRLPPSLRLPA